MMLRFHQSTAGITYHRFQFGHFKRSLVATLYVDQDFNLRLKSAKYALSFLYSNWRLFSWPNFLCISRIFSLDGVFVFSFFLSKLCFDFISCNLLILSGMEQRINCFKIDNLRHLAYKCKIKIHFSSAI